MNWVFSPSEYFRLNGVQDTDRLNAWVYQIAVYLQRTFHRFIQMGYLLGFKKEVTEIELVKDSLEEEFAKIGLKEPTIEEKKLFFRKMKEREKRQ